MFSLDNNIELKKVTISSVITCIYLPLLLTVIYLGGWLYTLGKSSSCFCLFIIFGAELLKILYLKDPNIALPGKKTKVPRNRASDNVKAIGFLISNVMVYFIIIILFGAPVLDNHEETAILSALLTLVTTLPLVAYIGVEMTLQVLAGTREYSKGTVIEMFVNNAILSVCGGWLGAVVIPLDWNAPWQQWPIPCYLGVLAGYFLSNMLTITRAIIVAAAFKYPILNGVLRVLYKYPTVK